MKRNTAREVNLQDSECKKICNMYRNMFPLATDSSEDQCIYNEDLQYELRPNEYEKDFNELIFNDAREKVFQNDSYHKESNLNRTPNCSKVNYEYEWDNNIQNNSLIHEDEKFDCNNYDDSKFLPFLGDEDGLEEPPHTLSSASPNFESLNIIPSKVEEFL